MYKNKNLPKWLKVKAPIGDAVSITSSIVRKHSLNTVCEEAACPNMGECWEKKHATFMILGSVCTRACAFCNVATGKPDQLDPHEPHRIAQAVSELGLKHVVLTSVDRDDLDDGGATHFSQCVAEIRDLCPGVTIEVLVPDFLHKKGAEHIIADACPDVFNHNIETVPSLYKIIRPGARYFNSLNLLYNMKQLNPDLFTKSGIMVGLGEDDDEIFQVMDDLRAAEVDVLTIGQYMRPTKKHAPVHRYVLPELFERYKRVGFNKGFAVVASGPLVRSSYHADEDFQKLKLTRNSRKISA